DRTGLDARVAVDADRGVDVELLRRLEVRGAGLGVDAVHGTHLDARVVLDATADDDIGHARQATYPAIQSAFRVFAQRFGDARLILRPCAEPPSSSRSRPRSLRRR